MLAWLAGWLAASAAEKRRVAALAQLEHPDCLHQILCLPL